MGPDDTTRTAANHGLISPVPEGTRVSQEYGANVENYSEWNDQYGHEGIDYAIPEDTPVQAAGSATVEYAGPGSEVGFGNYGNMVVLNHGNGVRTYYGHLNSFDVATGDTVEQGDTIALSGNTGRSTGAHLHFSVRVDGDESGPYGMVNPAGYLGQPDAIDVAAQPEVAAAPAVAASTFAVDNPASVAAVPASKPGLAAPAAAPVGAGYQVYDPTNPAGSVNLPPAIQTQAQAQTTTPTSIADYRVYEDTAKYPKSQQEAGILSGFQEQDQRGLDILASKYSKYQQAWEQYDNLLYDKEREAFREQNPAIRAMSIAAYNPDEHEEVERRFGPGAVMVWANIPKSDQYGGAPGERKAYFQSRPDAFLIDAWIDGRPDEYDPNLEFKPKNFGADYQEAEGMFGSGIWGTVREYQLLPDDDSYESRKARAIWHQVNPQYGAWSEWWYEKLTPTTYAQSASSGSYRSYGGSSGGSGFYPSSSGGVPSLTPVRPSSFEMARARRRGGTEGSWQKWLALSKQ